jgi:hypothetical protein
VALATQDSCVCKCWGWGSDHPIGEGVQLEGDENCAIRKRTIGFLLALQSPIVTKALSQTVLAQPSIADGRTELL